MGARVVTVNEVLGGHVRLESRPDAWRYGNPRSGSRPRPAGCRSGLSRGRPGAPLETVQKVLTEPGGIGPAARSRRRLSRHMYPW